MSASPTVSDRKTYEVKAIQISTRADAQAVAEWLGGGVVCLHASLDGVATLGLGRTDVFVDGNPKPVSVPAGDWLVRRTDGTFTSVPAAVFADVIGGAPRV